jgi:hypothetical protein
MEAARATPANTKTITLISVRKMPAPFASLPPSRQSVPLSRSASL